MSIDFFQPTTLSKGGQNRSGSRQDFREFAMPDETLGEFRYPKMKL